MPYAFPRVGDLRAEIAIEQRADDGSWAKKFDCWAEYVPLTGKEVILGDGTKPQRQVRFRTRYHRYFVDTDTRLFRIAYRGRIYNCTYVEDVRDAHVEVYLVCEGSSV